MLSLDGYLSAREISDIKVYTNEHFKDSSKFRSAEALTLYEQSYLEDTLIKELSEKAEQCILYEPVVSFMPRNIIELFDRTGAVPIQYMAMSNKIVAVYLNDIPHEEGSMGNYNVEYLPTTLYFYFKYYQEYYGDHPELLIIPCMELFNSIVSEAVDIGASDITISTQKKSAIIYYEVRKKKRYSKRLFTQSMMKDLILLLYKSNTFDFNSRLPQSVGYDLNRDWRGRVETVTKFQGYSITIRLIEKEAFHKTFNDLNISMKCQKFLKDITMDKTPGLRITAGATCSGKNTTNAACLGLITAIDDMKVISVEKPVEQIIPGVEQIDCISMEEYKANCEALTRQNPGYIYITEMNDSVGSHVIRVANTGKRILTTVHANSVSGTLTRLQDITGYSLDRLIKDIHSIVYQELLRNEEEDSVYPVIRYCKFDDKLKNKLYGRSLGEVIRIIEEAEDGD